MDRRAFIGALSGGLLVAPPALEAQQTGKVYPIGYTIYRFRTFSADGGTAPRATRARLHRGKNITIEDRFAKNNVARLRGLATELVGLKVDVIVTGGPTATRAAQEATRILPVVMAWGGDPVEARFVASLAHPAGNITGLTSMAAELGSKRLAFLKEAVPRVARVAVLWNPTHSEASASFRETEMATRARGLHLESIEVRSAGDLEGAFLSQYC